MRAHRVVAVAIIATGLSGAFVACSSDFDDNAVTAVHDDAFDARPVDGARDAAFDGVGPDGGPNDASVDVIDAQPFDAGPLSCLLLDGGVDASAPKTPTTGAGTRIHPRSLVLDDGTRLLYDAVDQQLDIACAVLPASDGTYRCLPTHDVKVHQSFTNAGCTIPKLVARTGVGCTTPKFVEDAGIYYTLGAKLSASGRWDKLSDGSCVAVPNDAFDDFEIGAVAPLSTFVAYAAQSEPIVAGLDAVVLVGADGSRVWRGDVRDSEHDVDLMMSGTHFLPRARVEAIESCCSPDNPPSCPALVDSGVTACLTPARWTTSNAKLATRDDGLVFRGGAPIATLYCPTVLDAGTCGTPTSMPSTGHRRIGDEVPAGCFFGFSSGPVGSARLRAYAWSTLGITLPLRYGPSAKSIAGDGFASLTTSVTDPMGALGAGACTMRRLTDGKIHCVPGGQYDGPLYIDDACTQERVVGNTYTIKAGRTECPLDVAQTVTSPGPIGTGPDVLHYRRDAYGRCVGVFLTRDVMPDAVVDPSAFVEVTIEE